MLTNLTISQFTIVEQLTVDFAQGMTAITGETGAGKSLTLDALSMVLGGRADSRIVRSGAEKSIIVAVFDVRKHPHIKQWLNDNDLTTEENECILRRVITKEGRSKASINSLPVNLQKLKELGIQLVDMHSQHAHHKLLQREHHESLLDAFANLQKDVTAVNHTYRGWQKKHQELNHLAQQLTDAENRKEYLKFQLQEFNELAIQAGEYQHCEKRHQQLASAEHIQQHCHDTIAICADSEQGIEKQLQQCLNSLESLTENSDHINAAVQLLQSAAIQVEEACTELKQSTNALQAAPQELVALEARLGSLHDLARKHRCNPEQLIDVQTDIEKEINNLQQGDDRLIELEHEVQQKRQAYHQQALTLSNHRELAARTLTKRIKNQLSKLGMASCQFSIALNHNSNQPKPTGYDAIEFLVSTNPGQPAQALQKIASGGELSRISLAIQVIIAETTAMPVLIFDEVDVGIGGATAEVVGRLMKKLAESSQIISITHQPQVASQANQHLIATKIQARKKTTTRITTLDTNARVDEIARMLGGVEITKRTIDHAREMLTI